MTQDALVVTHFTHTDFYAMVTTTKLPPMVPIRPDIVKAIVLMMCRNKSTES